MLMFLCYNIDGRLYLLSIAPNYCNTTKGGNTFGNSKKKSNNRAKKTLGASFDISDKTSMVVNAVSDGIAIIDGKGIVNSFNPAASKMTGWATKDAVNLDFRSIFKFFDIAERAIPSDQNPIIRAMHSVRSVKRNDIFLQTASKKYIRVSIKAAPFNKQSTGHKSSIFDKLNKPIGEDSGPGLPQGSSVIVIFRDITAEQKENHEQSDFISTASHEMRTPVAIIEGYLGMMLNPATATIDARARVYAEKAHLSAQHLGRLFQDLLDVTKLDDQRIRSNPILVDAGAAARQAVDNMQGQAQKKNLKLIYEKNAGEMQPMYIIYVDLDKLQEVLDNIIGNAIKYTRQGNIKVSVTESQSRVRISVTDTGIGIPAEDIPHLFQKFYRVDSSDTREIGGTGLGLYLIKHLTEHLGGQVGVDSDYGRGSTFWVEFNTLTRDQAIVKAREIKARQNQASQKLRKGI